MGNCLSRFSFMGDCWPSFLSSESTSPSHYGSTLSSHLNIETSDPSSEDSMEPYKRSPVDCGHFSLPMESFRRSSVASVGPSTPIDAIESIRQMYKKIDTVEKIDQLVSFLENQLQKINNPGSSSLDGWLETVRDGTKLVPKTIDTICTEAEKLSNPDILKAVQTATLKVLEGVGDLYWVFIGLSVAVYAVEKYLNAGSTEKECGQILVNIMELAKDINERSRQMFYERENLCNAVGNIVKGGIILCDYLKRANIVRFLSTTTTAAQVKNTNQQLRDVRNSLSLSTLQELLDFQWRKDYGGDKDVFLSHSGAQKNFVRQLYRDLKREHVSCFFDEDHSSLPLAQRFPPLIFKAAETCKIAVLLLSKEFVRSKWPMLELSAFITAMKSGKNPNLSLLPIFFAITPKELCDISKHEWQNLGITNDTKDEWQVALQVLRSINGLTFVEAGDEVELRDKVRKKICCFLNRSNPPLLLDFKPVGIDKQVREVKKLLKMEDTQSALAVIIYGFGGVGKSTVAASVVQSLDWSSADFKFCMVAIDEKTHNKTSHVIQLQKYIISKLGGVDPDFQNPLEGRIEIKKAMQNKCSLLLIDNVVDKDYIRDLLPQDLQSSQQDTKLRIIITSRDKNVSAELNIICNEYEVKCLSYADSKKLLMNTIVGSRMIDVEENRMIDEVAFACRGVPLLLSVFGKHLRVESKKDSYEEALDVLRKGNFDCYRDEDLSTKLMFVYEKIKDMDVKEAFLDICIYFHGWKWNLVADIVDSFKLEDLRRRTLVSKSGTGDVIVHEILRLMGMKEAKLSRFSKYEEFSEALEDNLHGIGNVKGLSVVSDSDKCSIKITELEAMHQSLRVLMLGDWVTLEGSPSLKAFKNLRYLHVGDIAAFPFKDPSKLDKLRVLVNRSNPGMILSHLPSGLKHISQELPDVEWDEFAKHPLQNLRSLKSFVVGKRKPVELPEELHLPSSLLDLQLIRCKKLPKDISHLSALESLILDRSDLEFLPQGYGNLNNLKHLSVNYCSKLASLSEELGMLSSLETLSMEYCGNLRALSQRLGALHSLQTLKLGGCINLLLLPESFGELCISSLQLHSLVNLQELPNSFGNMPLLKDLCLVSCHSLLSLPNSFVQLKMLETLEISHCSKLSVLPQDFGRLGYLKDMSVSDCHLLKELPHGFGALRSLRTFKLENCSSFVNLPRDFTELICLEHLSLRMLPLISRIPDGCGKLKKLKYLNLFCCFQLKTLPSDFENMATLEELQICHCPELNGAMMEKILNLQNCYTADIEGSRNLVEKLKQMEREIEHPIAVFSALNLKDEENEERALRQALLHGKFMEVDNCTDQFMERSSLFGGLEEGTIATVALIMLPTDIQAHQHQTLQRFVEMARVKAKTKGSGKLEIVCARKFQRTVQRSTPTEEEERAEEEGIRRILVSLRKGSCAIPSKSRRVKILSTLFARHWNMDSLTLDFLMADVVDMEGCRSFENLKFINERKMRPKKEQSHNSIQNFVDSICGEDEDDWETDEAGDVGGQCQCQYQSVAGQSRVREFIDALKANGIHHLLIDNNTGKVMVDDLDGKTIGFIICDFRLLEWMKFQQIYKEFQQKDSNFIGIWIPTEWPEDCGCGTYSRLIQPMPWATFPQPVNIKTRYPFYFFILDENGRTAKDDALPVLLGWDVESYPFTQHTIPESFSWTGFLLHGMKIVGRMSMKSKMTFLFAYRPSEWHKWKCQLEQLTQIHGNFEVLFVGRFFSCDLDDIEDGQQDTGHDGMEVYEDAGPYGMQEYEDAVEYMHWPALSFSDMIMFWLRCHYLAREECCKVNKESNTMMETLQGIVRHLHQHHASLVLVENDEIVTYLGEDLLQIICESYDEIRDGEGMGMRAVKDELILSLSRGQCTPLVKTVFRDEIDNHPQHPQHRISYSAWIKRYEYYGAEAYICDVCEAWRSTKIHGVRSYRCVECDWDMCRSCWMAWAKQQGKLLVLAADN